VRRSARCTRMEASRPISSCAGRAAGCARQQRQQQQGLQHPPPLRPFLAALLPPSPQKKSLSPACVPGTCARASDRVFECRNDNGGGWRVSRGSSQSCRQRGRGSRGRGGSERQSWGHRAQPSPQIQAKSHESAIKTKTVYNCPKWLACSGS
jgi:hypothetical protein